MEDSARQLLISCVNQWTTVPDAEWSRALSFFHTERFRKDEVLVRFTARASRLYFIVHGLVRLFYSSESGKEFNKSFAWEGMFVAGSLDPSNEVESQYGIEALEPLETLTIALEDFKRLMSGHPCWRSLFEAYRGWLADRKSAREKQLLLLSAEERYLRFQKEYPGLENRIPQFQIASYLGITSVALSRIRGRLKGQNLE